MSPEQRITALEQLVSSLVQQMKALSASSTIPFNVDKAFRNRLGIDIIQAVTVSATAANAQDQSVNEGGAASYTVLDDPDIFLQVTIGDTTYDIPAYNQ